MTSNVSRRDFLRWASAGAGAAAVGGGMWSLGHSPDGSPAGRNSTVSDATAAADRVTASGRRGSPEPAEAVSDLGVRRLIVIELDGGNDGLSTLVPYGITGYRDLRTATAVDAAEVLALDDEVGFHQNLGRLQQRGIAAVQGVGAFAPDLSHFEMMRRWWSGDPEGTGAYDTGFLGRLADAIGDPSAPAVALSIGTGSHPALVSRAVSTLALPSAAAADYLTGASPDDVMRFAFQRGLAAFSGSAADGVLGRLRDVSRRTTSFAETLSAMARDEQNPEAVEYPGSPLGDGLRLAADLVSVDNGVRIVHVPMGADFDTHEGHASRHPTLLDEFDAALDAFLADLERRGISDRVLVMTTSEFGRRARDNGADGLDHGTASTALVMGPVVAGRHGEHPSLTALGEDDNLVATLGLDSYYASVAEGWFGVPASELFSRPPALVDGLFT